MKKTFVHIRSFFGFGTAVTCLSQACLALFAAFCCTSCIKNDIPYPVVVPHILSMNVEGALSVTPDPDNYVVNVVLGETVDLKRVNIKSFSLDKEDVKLSREIVGVHNLVDDFKVVLTTYQDYEWTIHATRPIERYCTVDNQVGAAVIDDVNRRVIIDVRKDALLSDVNITSLKLGPKDMTTYVPSVDKIRNFTDNAGNPTYVEVEVNSFGDSETWKIYVNNTDVVVNVRNVNVWTKEVYITADGISGQHNGFKYRKKSESGWIDVTSDELTTDGGRFVAHIKGLEPATTYEFYAFSGADMTDVEEFTTDPARQFPNNSFEIFSIVKGNSYYKWYDPSSSVEEGRTIWWASGNGEGPEGVNGTGSLGIVLTYPDNNEKMDGDWSVRCESKNFAGLLACGNLFTGRFAGLEGTTGGSVNYGRPWTTRPHKLRVWMKYISKPVHLIKNMPVGESVKDGDPDRCEIAVSIGNWDYRRMGGVPESPVYVNTSKNRYYNSRSEGIIAFGHLVLDRSTDGWVQQEIELEYRSLTEIPTHIIVTCASSYLGDYLTGADGSTLWIDKMELVYD